jgi:MYXO-CTERM domain-containing protein
MMRRASSRLLAAALLTGIAAFASTVYLVRLRRDFSARTAFTTGTVIRSGGTGRSRRGSATDDLLCWVEYEFFVGDAPARTNWRMFDYGCFLKPGAQIPIQYVVGSPQTNRPANAEPPLSPMFWWFVAGVLAVIGLLRRRSDRTEGANDEGYTSSDNSILRL